MLVLYDIVVVLVQINHSIIITSLSNRKLQAVFEYTGTSLSIRLAMRLCTAALVLALARAQHLENDPNFQMNDLVDWSSFPGRSDLDPEDEDVADFKTLDDKRNDPNFNINELVDWSSVKLPGMEATEQNEEIANADMPGEHLSPDDFIAADFVKESFDGFGADPIEAAGLFEGDIENVLFDDLKASKGRNAIRESWRKWPGATVPYVISSSFSTNERRVIAKAMKEYQGGTCIRFTPRTSEQAYIHIMKGNGYSSSIGKNWQEAVSESGHWVCVCRYKVYSAILIQHCLIEMHCKISCRNCDA